MDAKRVESIMAAIKAEMKGEKVILSPKVYKGMLEIPKDKRRK